MENQIAQNFIDVLRGQIVEIDDQLAPLLTKRKAKASLANATAADAGLPLPFPDDTSIPVVGTAAPFVESISPDQYTGKKLATVVREILQRRKSRGLSAISLDDLYTQLKAGGFDFGTRDIANAVTSLSTTLGKNVIFRRVPNNPKLWGLADWYGGPNKRKTPDTADSNPEPEPFEVDFDDLVTPPVATAQPGK